MRRFTMLACLGLKVWGSTATFHAICVYSTQFMQLLCPQPLKNRLFINCAQMRRFTMVACVGPMLWGCSGLHAICVYSTEFIQPLYRRQLKKCCFYSVCKCCFYSVCKCGALLCSTVPRHSMLYACIRLIAFTYYTSTFHTLCVYTTDCIHLLYAYKLKDCLL